MSKFKQDRDDKLFVITVASKKGGRGARAPHFPERGAEPPNFQASVTLHIIMNTVMNARRR